MGQFYIVGDITRKHEDVPQSVIDNLPALLADPLVIYSRQEGENTALIEVLTSEGEPLLVGFRAGEIRTITSKHRKAGKSGSDLLAGEINRSTIIYARDKKALADAKAIQEGRRSGATIAQERFSNARGQSLSKKVLFKADIVKQYEREGEDDPLFSLKEDNGPESPAWKAAKAKGLDMSKAARMEQRSNSLFFWVSAPDTKKP